MCSMTAIRRTLGSVCILATVASCGAFGSDAPAQTVNPASLTLVCPTDERSDVLIDLALDNVALEGDPDPIALAREYAVREFRVDEVGLAGTKPVLGGDGEAMAVYLARQGEAPKYKVIVTKTEPGGWIVTAAESCG